MLTSYEGETLNGRPHGKGKSTYTDGGLVYEGDFVDGKEHGKDDRKQHRVKRCGGKRRNVESPNESPYNSEGKLALASVRAKIKYVTGDMYEGEFYNDKLHGKGKMSYADGTIEEQIWHEGGKQ